LSTISNSDLKNKQATGKSENLQIQTTKESRSADQYKLYTVNVCKKRAPVSRVRDREQKLRERAILVFGRIRYNTI